MNNINIDELYEIYRRTNNGFLSKISFNRILKSKKTEDCIATLRAMYGGKYGHDYVIDEQKLYIGFFNLLNKYSFSDLYKIIQSYDYDLDDGKKEIFSVIGINYPLETINLDLSFAVNLICNDCLDFNSLLATYGETIYNAMLDVDLYKRYIYSNLEMGEIESYEDFLRNRASESKNKKLLSAFNTLLHFISKRYTVDELINDSERVKNEISTGITSFLPELTEEKGNLVSDNREVFDAMANHFDSKTLEVIVNISDYLSPLKELINSNRLNKDDLLSIKKIYALFSNISECIDKKDIKGLFDLVEQTIVEGENGFEFYDTINEYIITYEEIIRKDIINNVNTFENIPKETITFTNSKGEDSNIECSYVSSCSELSLPLIHIFRNPDFDSKEIAYYYLTGAINVIGEHTLLNHTRSKDSLKEVIVQLYNLFNKYTRQSSAMYNQNTLEEIKKEISKILTPEECKLCDDRYRLNVEHYQNYAEVTQINETSPDLYNFLMEETEDFCKPLIPGLDDNSDINYILRMITRPTNQNIVATQLLRLNSYNDFNSLIHLDQYSPYVMAVSFDKRGLSEDSIMISSTDNIETNNRSIVNFSETYPLRQRSASLDMVKSTIGQSGMTNRKNSEIDLIRPLVTSQCLLFFFNIPVTDKIIEGVKKAQEIANKSNLKLVLVDYQSICNELQARESKEESREMVHEEELESGKSR